MSPGKKPKKKGQVDTSRQPRVAPGTRPQSAHIPRARVFSPPDPTGKVVVQFSRIDLDSEWCLTKITVDDHRALLERIRGFESMTVNEVFHGLSEEPGKDYPVENLPNKAATDRLLGLGLDDQDVISRLRISGTGRLYGFRVEQRFYALWWDPNHEIWPSTRR